MWWDDGDWHHIAVDTAPMSHVQGTHGSSSSNGAENSAAVVIRLWLDGAIIGDSASPGAGRWSQTLSNMPSRSGKARALLGDDPSSGLYPLAGLVRDIEVDVFNGTTAGSRRVWPPPPPCVEDVSTDMGYTQADRNAPRVAERIESRCSAARTGGQYWLWRLDNNFNEACGSGLPLNWKSHSSASTSDGRPQAFVRVLRKPTSRPLQPASPAPPVPKAAGDKPNEATTARFGTGASLAAGSVASFAAEAEIDEVDMRTVTPKTSDASLVELFRSTPATSATNSAQESLKVNKGNPARPLVVLYFSDHSGAWDAYWELYHIWTVTVLLRDVRRKRPVCVLLVRCPPTNCTLPSLAASAAIAATKAAQELVLDLPDIVGNTIGGTSSEKSSSKNDPNGSNDGDAVTVSFDLLATVNAHGLPRLNLASLAAALRAHFPKQHSRLYLFHQNHEKPWKLGRATSSSSISDKKRRNDNGSSKSLLGPLHPSFDRTYESGGNADLDWRNGYPGGLPALAAGYACWDGVLRQYDAPELAAAAKKAVDTRQAALHPTDKTTSIKPVVIGRSAKYAGSSLKADAAEAKMFNTSEAEASTSSRQDMWRLTYVPLGPAFDGDVDFAIDASSSPNGNAGKKNAVLPASQRPTLCYFAGAEAQWGGSPDRANLLAALARAEAAAEAAAEASKDPSVSLSLSSSRSRSSSSTKAPLCELHLGASPRSENEPAGRPMPRPAYLDGLARAVLAPVPQGNNGETFRHFEALAQGALPVAVRPSGSSASNGDHSNDGGDNDINNGEGPDVNAVRNAYLDEWCPNYHTLPSSAHVHVEAPNIVDEGHARATNSNASKVLAALDAHLATSSCPILLLDSWDDLPPLIFALGSSNGGWNRASANAEGTLGDESDRSVAPSAAEVVDRWQQLVRTRYEEMKCKAGRDVSVAFGE